MHAPFQAATTAPTGRYRGRFAPSPTGPLHAGSLLAALGSWLFARHASGEWLVRMEDLDPPREVPGMAAAQLEALARFGLEADGPVLFQSTRGARYAEALQALVDSGDAFECWCTRGDLEPLGGIHRACVAAPSGRHPAWRLRLPELEVSIEDRIRGRVSQNLAASAGDVILRRADGPWAYQLAVVVDDADQGITDIVRGADLLDSTPRQAWLQQRLGVSTPGYAHLPLLRLPDGRKLSKSAASAPVDPADPLPALARAWEALGQAPGALSGTTSAGRALARALAEFEPLRIPSQDRQLPTE